MKKSIYDWKKITMILEMIKSNLKRTKNTDEKLLREIYNNRIINEYCALRGKINTDSFRKDL